jgi:hypothetical protein
MNVLHGMSSKFEQFVPPQKQELLVPLIKLFVHL